MRILSKKFVVADGGEKKEFTIHKFKATECINVFRAILNCLANTDLEFTDALGFAPAVLEAYAHLKMGTGAADAETDKEDLQRLQEAIRLRRSELLFYLFKLALKSLDKDKTDELLGYLVYGISIDEINRMTNAANSANNIDNYVETGAALLLLCREVLEFNFSDFFLGFQKSDIQ